MVLGRYNCRRFLSPILCRAGTVVMKVAFLSGSQQRYQFCYVCKIANPIAPSLSPWKGGLKWRRNEGLLLHFVLIITSGIEQNCISTWSIWYNTKPYKGKMCNWISCLSFIYSILHTGELNVLYIKTTLKHRFRTQNKIGKSNRLEVLKKSKLSYFSRQAWEKRQ